MSSLKLKPRTWILLLLAALLLGWFGYSWLSFPSDRTPDGAYLRVVSAVNRDLPEAFFAYLEEPAQHAAYSVIDYRTKSLALARATFPQERRDEIEKSLGAYAAMEDGSDYFAYLARQEGWLDQLRRDMSGISEVIREGERATVVTVRKTRYSFRLRPGGIWGMTAFTSAMVEEAEQAARDHLQMEKAAQDYRRVHGSKAPRDSPVE